MNSLLQSVKFLDERKSLFDQGSILTYFRKPKRSWGLLGGAEPAGLFGGLVLCVQLPGLAWETKMAASPVRIGSAGLKRAEQKGKKARSAGSPAARQRCSASPVDSRFVIARVQQSLPPAARRETARRMFEWFLVVPSGA